MDNLLKQAHTLAVECVERAMGTVGFATFFKAVGVASETVAAERIRNIEHNAAELTAIHKKLFLILANPAVVERLRQAHHALRAESPAWLRSYRSAHEAAERLGFSVLAGCHNAQSGRATAMEKWQAVVGALAAIPRYNLPPLLDGEYAEVSHPAPPQATTETPAADRVPAKKATVEARMFDLIKKDSSTHAWPARRFAEKLGCSLGAVAATSVWRELSTSRESARQARSAEAYHKNRDR